MSTALLDSLVSDEQITQFTEFGYCLFENLYTSEQINEIEAFFEDWKSDPVAHLEGSGTSFAKLRIEDVDRTKQQVRSIHPHRTSPKVLEWLLEPRVARTLETLLGKPPLAAQSMYYFKPPGTCGQGMHQDNFYLLAKPATCIAAWTAIDDSTEENGCLLMLPGSQRWDILCSGHDGESWTVNKHGVIGNFPEKRKPTPVTVRRGQTLVFGGNVIHGSCPNRSKDRWRRTFIGHYVDAMTESMSRFYHPVINMNGETVSRVAEHTGGGPCSDNEWEGAVH
jgi:ectoine hydroxylase-related dioxygenase (phytanoyl-CoA dioxygenase family)